MTNWAFRRFVKNQPQEDKAAITRKLEADRAVFFSGGGKVDLIEAGRTTIKEGAAPYLGKYGGRKA